jgi:hypothetical protein
VNFIVLDVLSKFVGCFEEELNSEPHPITERVFSLLEDLHSSTSELFLSCLLSATCVIIFKLPKPLFVFGGSSYCQSLVYDFLRHCISQNSVVRSKASATFYLLMKVLFFNFFSSFLTQI